MNRDERILWNRNIREVIGEFADPDYQARVSSNYCEEKCVSYTEAMCQLFNDYCFDLYLVAWKENGLSLEVPGPLKRLRNLLDSVRKKAPMNLTKWELQGIDEWLEVVK